jgi:hypothetical protein
MGGFVNWYVSGSRLLSNQRSTFRMQGLASEREQGVLLLPPLVDILTTISTTRAVLPNLVQPIPIMNTLTGRLSRSLPARSSLRAFSLTPSRAFVPTQAVRAGHGKHPVPPEGDIDHGRSGWGFQSHSRHEHFTFPGEDPDPYETNESEFGSLPGRSSLPALLLLLSPSLRADSRAQS